MVVYWWRHCPAWAMGTLGSWTTLSYGAPLQVLLLVIKFLMTIKTTDRTISKIVFCLVHQNACFLLEQAVSSAFLMETRQTERFPSYPLHASWHHGGWMVNLSTSLDLPVFRAIQLPLFPPIRLLQLPGFQIIFLPGLPTLCKKLLKHAQCNLKRVIRLCAVEFFSKAKFSLFPERK